MNAPLTQRLAGLAERLEYTLQEERDALRAVSSGIKEQLAALTRGDYPRVEELTMTIDSSVHQTASLREAHVRQATLLLRVATGQEPRDASLARVVATLRDEPGHDAHADRLETLVEEIRAQAQDTERKRATLEFSLLGAQRVGRSLLTGLHGLVGPATTSVYTAKGAREQSTGGHTLLNRVG